MEIFRSASRLSNAMSVHTCFEGKAGSIKSIRMLENDSNAEFGIGLALNVGGYALFLCQVVEFPMTPL